MPVTQERAGRKTKGRGVRVTGRKLALPAPASVQAVFGLDPREGARPRVALMASEGRSDEMLDTAAIFIDSNVILASLADPQGPIAALVARVEKLRRSRGVSPSVRLLRVQRLHNSEYNGFPLRRTLLVVFNRDGQSVTAEFTETAGILKIQGVGTGESEALIDLERQFEEIVRTKVRIPPHVRKGRDEAVRNVVNHLVDWEKFNRENPTPHLLWGRINNREPSSRPTVYWLVGPDSLRKQTRQLPQRLASPYFLQFQAGDWFHAVIMEYPDRFEWVETPRACPDPNDPAARKAAWDAIPIVYADNPDIWPLKGS